jgi:uncharacterized PurR-regulated membrane protein YhhQ (DUF165 family)
VSRKLLAAGAFIAIVVAANVATNTLGIVTWLGITATAGTWLAGLAFVARDEIQETGGRWWILAAIGAGTILSALFNPRLALASGVAFGASELADWAIYTPLRKRHRLAAMITSNTVGAVVDSLIFLSLAEYPLFLIWGQVGIKVGMTLLAVGGRHAVLRQPVRQRTSDQGHDGG